jgi:hypothetical protein
VKPAGAAPGRRRRAARVAVLAAALLAPPALLALHFRDGPPARVTGGPGEESCAACHTGNAVNAAGGELTIEGFPERYTPGKQYSLELVLSRPQLAAAGFQLAIRHRQGQTQAGRIGVPEGSEQAVGILDERGVQFAHQLLPDVAPPGAGTMRWKLAWTAPESAGPVVLHAAAIAADGDDSQLGDFVYTLERSAIEP